MPLRDAYFLISGKFYSSHIGDVFGRKEYGSLTFPHTQNLLSPDRVPLRAHTRDDHHVPHGARKTLEAFSSTLRDKIDRSLPRRGWRTQTTLKTPSQAPRGHPRGSEGGVMRSSDGIGGLFLFFPQDLL